MFSVYANTVQNTDQDFWHANQIIIFFKKKLCIVVTRQKIEGMGTTDK